LGSALGDLAAEIRDPVVIRYEDIPNFLVSTVHSHAGELILGMLAGRRVVCMSGRFHYYEGYSFEQLAAPVRLFKMLGAGALVLTNAAGAVNTSYKPGDVMVIKDHINLMGASPMRGPNVDAFGPRFFDAGDVYTRVLRHLALKKAVGSGLDVREGVYQFFCGPHFETPAEIRAARVLGADAVGMSTVTEALTAAHCGMPLLGLSVITNMAAGVLNQPLSASEVNETAARVSTLFTKYVMSILETLPVAGGDNTREYREE
ncbi:MAG: purine-nucleoside phosphorylase, partial [Spirochaetales bacterium]|nr:purine-nucleoside phosphorylase [Spirochaetales bacterium]